MKGNSMATYNQEQQQLIDASLTHKVVGVAGAGTGKTTTILGRTQRVLKEFKTGKVVLITFTRMAANDMRQRLMRQLNEKDARRVTVGTFHSIIGQLIRENAVNIGLQPSFSIIDENSTNVMYQSIIENNDTYFDLFTEWFIGPEGNPFDPKHTKLLKADFKKFSGAISTMVNTSYPDELMTGQFGDETKNRLSKILGYPSEMMDALLPTYHAIFKDSLALGRETNTVNYDHILFIGYLMTKSGMLDTYSESIVHMIVDEYQDTNLLQDAFVRAVGGNKLTIVGDVDQAIYEFRGGKAELIDEHAKEAEVINLTLNYRSFQPILDIGNTIIQKNKSGKDIRKPLRANREFGEEFGGILQTHALFDKQESDHIISRIKFLMSKGVSTNDIAILVRSRMSIASINMALQKSKIPINDTTKFADFMKSDVMRDTLNFIKIFTNPKDIYAFMGILDRPKRGLGAKAIQTLQENAANHALSVVEYLLSEHIAELTPAMRKKVQSFVDVYQTLIDPDNQHMSLPDMVTYVLNETGYVTWVNGLKNNETHKRNLEILKGMVADFTREYDDQHANYTLFDIANAFTFEMTSSIRQEDKDGVTIATIHGSKGLEWKHVITLGMEQENFPGKKVVDDADMESERRLMYVAVTRAKDSLWLCQSDHRITYGDQELTPSQFLDEAGELPVKNL